MLVSVSVCPRGARGEDRTRKRKERSRAVRGRFVEYCSDIRLVVIGVLTENYRSEHPGFIPQSADELDLA